MIQNVLSFPLYTALWVLGYSIVFLSVFVLDVRLFHDLAFAIVSLTGKRIKRGRTIIEGLLIEMFIGGCTYVIVYIGIVVWKLCSMG
jgi:hypothetical protein